MKFLIPLSIVLVGCASGGGDPRRPSTDTGPPSLDGGVTPDDGGTDTGADAGPPEACETDADCDDGVACTADACTSPARDCTHTVDDGACPAGQVCDAIAGCVDPPPCVTDAECDDGLVCNGTETCDPDVGCRAGMAIDCDDGVTCTVDSCEEPAGACVNAGTDADGDGYVAVGCGAGDDCDDSNPAVSPAAAETCNGVDDDCSGAADDAPGSTCVAGSPPSSCTTMCGTSGTRPCTASCTFGACVAATETCMNGCDDDGDGMIDEGCAPPPPPNDQCGGAIALSGSGARSADTLVSATAQTADCGSGVEVFYRVSVARRSIVYLDTFGSGFDTRISYRGTGCPGSSSQCVDDSCSTLQTQLARVVDAGTHYFAVHTYSSFTTPGPIALTHQIVDAAGGDNTPITTSGTFPGSTSGSGAVSATCAGGAGSPEDAFYWMQCPGVSRSVTATTCSPSTTYDTALHLYGGSTPLACNDDDFGCTWDAYHSRVAASTSGAGLFRIFVDGYSSFSSGSYSLTVSGL
jgi:hypothetical protein